MDVTVYTTQTCPYCLQVKEYLSRRSIPFHEVDVSRDAAAAAEMVRVSGQRGVPVTVIDGQVVIGFDRPRLDRLLAQAQKPRLGAAVADAANMAAKGRCRVSQGAYLGRVTPEGAAAQAGLRPGDVIISFANHPVSSALELEQLIARLPSRQAVPATYVRGNQQYETLIRF